MVASVVPWMALFAASAAPETLSDLEVVLGLSCFGPSAPEEVPAGTSVSALVFVGGLGVALPLAWEAAGARFSSSQLLVVLV